MPNNVCKYLYFLLIGVLLSCNKTEVKSILGHSVHHVLILGNSITYAPANPAVGWNGNWGMAASAADKDYVHLLTARFKELNSLSTVDIKNIAEFEAYFDTYDFNQLQTLRDAKPDLIILRIGENVTRVQDAALFEKKYVELLNYLKTNNTRVKILAVGSVWPLRTLANTVMKKYSDYITLISLHSDNLNFAYGLFDNPGVASHPSDKGMKYISDQIWAKVQRVL